MKQIQTYQIESLTTGTFALDGGAMFGVVPKLLWNSKIPSDESNRIPLSLRSLLIKGEGRIILIDAGIGEKWSPKQIEMFDIHQSKSPLEMALKERGVALEDVTDLIITHMHFDHIGGATRYDSNRKLIPTLPNAKVYVQKTNWEHANQPNEKDKASYLSENFLPLEEFGLVDLIDGEKTILPGIHLIPTNGHTIGQQMVKIGEGKHSLLYCGDVVPTSAHLPIPWVMGYDLYPMTTIEEKKEYLPKAAKENWILFFEHDPLIDSCTIQWTEKGPMIAETNVIS